MDGDNPGDDPAGGPDETFPPTNGRVLGVVALVVGLGIAALALLDGAGPVWVGVSLGLLFAGLAWSALLRPRVAIQDDDLVLRNMLDTVRVPLAAVEEVVVRQVLAVRAGDRRFTSPAVGRTRRQMARDDRGLGGSPPSGNDPAALAGQAFGIFVQERIRERAKDARDRLGIRVASAEQDALAAHVRREPAVLEIVWLVGTAVASVVLIVV